jgi:hypothetical protein
MGQKQQELGLPLEAVSSSCSLVVSIRKSGKKAKTAENIIAVVLRVLPVCMVTHHVSFGQHGSVQWFVRPLTIECFETTEICDDWRLAGAVSLRCMNVGRMKPVIVGECQYRAR